MQFHERIIMVLIPKGGNDMRKQTKIWVTKDKKKVRVCNMSDKHLLNTIKYLENKAQDTADNISYPSFYGEIAQDISEDIYEKIQQNPVGYFLDDSIYNDLLTEKNKRGL